MTIKKGEKIPASKVFFWIAIFILLLGISLSVFSYSYQKELRNQYYAAELAKIIENYTAELNTKIVTLEAAISALRSFFYASEKVTREEFLEFVEPYYAAFQGVYTFEWIPKVQSSERNSFELDQQQDVAGYTINDFVDGEMRPSAKRKDYFPVTFAAPLVHKRGVIGFDISTHPERLAAINLAIAKNSLIATAPIIVPYEERKEAAIQILLPLYVDGIVPDGLSERKSKTISLVGAVFFVKDLLKNTIWNFDMQQINFRIYDVSASKNSKMLLYQNFPLDKEIHKLKQQTKKNKHIFFEKKDMLFGSRHWEFVVIPKKEFFYQYKLVSPIWFLVIGLFFTALIFLIIIMLFYKNKLIQQQVDIRTLKLANSLHCIEKKNEELLLAKRKAEESDKLKTAFLANMGHEIRTPMNAILGFAELLRDVDLNGQDQKKYISIIEKSGRRMLNLINDLIDISKIEAGVSRIHLKEVSINTLLDELFLLFENMVKEKGLSLRCHKGLPDAQSITRVDSDRLIQVLTNLMFNAIKFTHSGEISFGYTQKEDFLEFYVADTGIGISENMKDVIFERFRQADIRFSRDQEGLGLGLSISKAFVTIHGGKIWVDSEVGRGSTFYFTLPYVSCNVPEESFSENKKEQENDLVKALKILIVEDNESNALLLKNLFQKYNCQLLFVKDGQEAVTIVDENTDINLILMDIKLEQMDGLEATRLIKEKYPNMSIIIQTAFAQKKDEESALAAGADAYISKPIDFGLLLKLIKRHV